MSLLEIVAIFFICNWLFNSKDDCDFKESDLYDFD